MPKSKLGQMCLNAGIIDEHQLSCALAEQRSWGGRLGDILVKSGFVQEVAILRVLSEQLNLPVIHLKGKEIDVETIALLTREDVEKYDCLPLFIRRDGHNEVLYVAMSDPSNLEALDTIQFTTGMMVEPVLASSKELKSHRARYYSGLSSKRVDAQGSPMSYGAVSGIDVGSRAIESEVPQSFAKPASTHSTQSKTKTSRVEDEKVSPKVMFQALAGLLIKKEWITLEELSAEIETLSKRS